MIVSGPCPSPKISRRFHRGLAHNVIEDAAALVGRVTRVEESAVVFFDGHAEVARAGQTVGEQLARFQVENAILGFILAAVADAVSQQRRRV